METLSKDMYYEIGKYLEIKDLIQFCETNKRANEKICKNDAVWRYCLDKEFPDWKDFNLDKSLLNIYIYICLPIST